MNRSCTLTIVKLRRHTQPQSSEITAWWDEKLIEKYLNKIVSFKGDLNKLNNALAILNAGALCVECAPVDPIKMAYSNIYML